MGILLSQSLGIVNHCPNRHSELKNDLTFGFALALDVGGQLDLLQIARQNGLQNDLENKMKMVFIVCTLVSMIFDTIFIIKN